ncbi:MAG: hypothetical protein HY303_08435 [Candidatus Wallbacteria bacterium]|nr:hypothetical protein [Candidatus Wallbacteria bacterium]
MAEPGARLEPRPLWQTVLMTAGLLALTLSFIPLAVGLDRHLAEPIDVRLVGLSSASLAGAEVARISPRGKECALAPGNSRDSWSSTDAWARAIRIRLNAHALAELSEVVVTIGGRAQRHSRAELLAAWLRSAPRASSSTGAALLEGGSEQLGAHSALSPGHWLINWPASGDRIASLVPWPVAISAAFLALGLIMRVLWARPRIARCLETALGYDRSIESKWAPEPRGTRVVWFVAGLAVVVVGLGILELLDPYYFTRVDNLVSVLPGMIWSCRALDAGHFPSWTPNYFLGSPVSEVGFFGVYYPPALLSWWLARHWFGNELLTLEIFMWMHLIAAYAAAFFLLKRLRVGAALSASASMSCALSGYSLVVGRAWNAMGAFQAWNPALLLGAIHLIRGRPTWRWVLVVGAVVGVSFHTGHSQAWFNAVASFCLVTMLLALTVQIPVARLLWIAPTLLLGLALAVPVLLPLTSIVSSAARIGGLGAGIAKGLPALLLPYPFARAMHPNDWIGESRPEITQFYYSGTIFLALGLMAAMLLVGSVAAVRPISRIARSQTWTVCGILAFLMALGRPGFLWLGLCSLPFFSKFRDPFRFFPFANLFLIAAGAVLLQTGIARARRPGLAGGLVFGTVALLLLYHVSLAPPGQHDFGFLPYPRLEGLAEPGARPAVLDRTGRYFPLLPRFGSGPDYSWGLGHDLAALYDLYSMDGFDPLIQVCPENTIASEAFARDPVGTMQCYGVRWVLEHRLIHESPVPPRKPGWEHTGPSLLPALAWGAPESVEAPLQAEQLRALAVLQQVKKIGRSAARFPAVTVWELPQPDPLAFAVASPAKALPVAFGPGAACVDVHSLSAGGAVIVNVLRRAPLHAYVDSRPVPSTADRWGRVEVNVPAGGQELELRYESPWTRWLLVAAALVLVSAVLTIALSLAKLD